MNAIDAINKGFKWVKKNRSLITTITGCIGVAATVYFTSKATIKIEECLKDAEDEAAIKSKKKEVVKHCIKPAISAAVTIACILLTYKFGKADTMGLMAISAGGVAALNKYRESVIDAGKLSPEEEEKIFEESMSYNPEAKIPDAKEYPERYELFKEELTGEYFYATPDIILNAQIKLNRNINIGCYETFWFWLQCLTDNDTFAEYENGARRCGWCDNAEETYGYRFVDISPRKMVDEDGREYTLITYPFRPHTDFEDIDWTDSTDYSVLKLLKSR